MKLSKFAHKLLLKKDTYAVFNNILFKPILMTKEEVTHLWNGNFTSFSKKELKKMEDSINNSNESTVRTSS